MGVCGSGVLIVVGGGVVVRGDGCCCCFVCCCCFGIGLSLKNLAVDASCVCPWW